MNFEMELGPWEICTLGIPKSAQPLFEKLQSDLCQVDSLQLATQQISKTKCHLGRRKYILNLQLAPYLLETLYQENTMANF